MRSVKLNFNGDSGIGIDWGSEVSGMQGLTQKVCVNVMTDDGSDQVLPERGNTAAKELLGHGSFDYTRIQHTLNFAALDAMRDIRIYQGDLLSSANSLKSVQLLLIDVTSGQATVAIEVANTAGESTQTVTKL